MTVQAAPKSRSPSEADQSRGTKQRTKSQAAQRCDDSRIGNSKMIESVRLVPTQCGNSRKRTLLVRPYGSILTCRILSPLADGVVGFANPAATVIRVIFVPFDGGRWEIFRRRRPRETPLPAIVRSNVSFGRRV
mmetsp:Transcript_31661/g.67444  ORF Transcript_31661/g.67444 Transcript_31661/m.67444 type:complete len:134 (-) Transcript_31661:66-467(-)